MSHDDLKDLLALYLDAAASPAEAARVESHLAACDECRAFRDGWSRWRPALAAARSAPAPAFTARVMARVRSEPVPRAGLGAWVVSRFEALVRPRWAVPLGAAAAAVWAVMVFAPGRTPAPVSVDSAQFVAELLPTVDVVENGADDVSNDIETYFL